jgi:glycosyltransferase involved in cell wall biosynthesis
MLGRMGKDFTFVIKTLLRPRCAHRLIDSIVAIYPTALILVADDSPTPISRKGVKVFHLPNDCGISFGRNYLVDRVDTPFFVCCDDDIVLTQKTQIDNLLLPLRADTYDLVATHYFTRNRRLVWEGIFERLDDVLVFRAGDRGQLDGIYRYDMCHNFFVAKTAKVRALRWDDELKVGEHTDFFLRALGRLRVGVNPCASIVHLPETNPEYAIFRSRLRDFRPLFMKKHGLRIYRNEILPDASYELPLI